MEARTKKKLQLFERDNPVDVYRLATREALELSRIKFCETYEGELNLVDESPAGKIYWHLQEGALWEAEGWAKKLSLEDNDVIFIYGLGLGYYYLPLKKWLEKPGRHLVFLEDTLPVIYYFLQTELAEEILKNPQVMVKVLPKVEASEEGWEELRKWASPLFDAFAFSKPAIFALNSYFAHRFDFFHAFSAEWLSGLCEAQRRLCEFYPNNSLIFHNFYANIYHLPEAIPGYKLSGTMQDIPAVLCGAGPSLSKQLPLLKTLSEKAFIMASGSAMNVVTQDSMIPHAGGAIDPTETQASRLLTSFAFNVPAFYQNCFFDKAFKQWHGPLLYMTGCGGYRVSEWFEKELGIERAVSMIMGVSTSNFLLEIAGFLGCNPLVFIGMDLAYTEEARYAKGVSVHPADDPEHLRSLESKAKAVVAVPGVKGKDVCTNNQWFYEAVCISAFKERNPHLVCLNATEGGMAIPSVPNAVFSEVAATYFLTEWDIEGWFHGAIQNVSNERIALKNIFQAMDKWKRSLERCLRHLDLLKQCWETSPETFSLESEKKHSLTGNLYSGPPALWQKELYQEPAYAFLLETLNTVFEKISSLRIRKLKWLKQKEREAERLALEADRCLFLRDYAEDHLKSLSEAKKSYEEWSGALSKKVVQKEELTPLKSPPEYRLKEGFLSIREPDLGVDVTVEYRPQLIPQSSLPEPGKKTSVDALVGKIEERREGQTLSFYSEGTVKAEAFYRSDRLHGPWSFYSPDGVLLFRRWYVDGKKEGKSCAYYSGGALYCLQGYKGGVSQGTHVYYYPDGTVKSVVPYDNGLLHGPVKLYYSNGRLMKEQFFDQGKLHGKEQVWNERGTLIFEAFYRHGTPCGISRKWDSAGILVREVEIR